MEVWVLEFFRNDIEVYSSFEKVYERIISKLTSVGKNRGQQELAEEFISNFEIKKEEMRNATHFGMCFTWDDVSQDKTLSDWKSHSEEEEIIVYRRIVDKPTSS